MRKFRDERGAILITVLILMAVIALIGTIAINTSTTDVQLMGQFRRSSTTFEGAEAGTDLSVPIIEQTLAAGTLTPTSFTVGSDTVTIHSTVSAEVTTNLREFDDDETDGPAGDNGPDFVIPDLGGVQVSTDIDRMYTYTIEGGAMQFASGYEGVGHSAAGGGVGILFKITSRGER